MRAELLSTLPAGRETSAVYRHHRVPYWISLRLEAVRGRSVFLLRFGEVADFIRTLVELCPGPGDSINSQTFRSAIRPQPIARSS